MIEVSKAPPAFTLPDQNGEKIALKDLKGQWIVLYFYPKDDTPGCTTQACEFTESIQDFQKLNARVFGISPDDAASHQQFIAKFDLKVDLLSDPQHKVMEKYQAYGEKNMYGKVTVGVIRSTVVIDPEGKVAKHWKRAQSKGHAAKVQEFLTKAQSEA